MDHLVELVSALAWPITTIVVALLFRHELRQLAGRVSQLKYKDVEATFEKQLVEVEAEAARIPSPPEPELLEGPTAAAAEGLRRIAEISPRAAVLEAWTMIETAAMQSGLATGSAMPRVTARSIMTFLRESGRLSEESLQLIEDLRRLRNRAAHLPDVAITVDEAERYLALAEKSAAIIRRPTDGT